MSVLAGVGTAGVPGGSIPLIVVVLRSVGVPPDGVAIILGVDRVLDIVPDDAERIGDLHTRRLRSGDGRASGS